MPNQTEYATKTENQPHELVISMQQTLNEIEGKELWALDEYRLLAEQQLVLNQMLLNHQSETLFNPTYKNKEQRDFATDKFMTSFLYQEALGVADKTRYQIKRVELEVSILKQQLSILKLEAKLLIAGFDGQEPF